MLLITYLAAFEFFLFEFSVLIFQSNPIKDWSCFTSIFYYMNALKNKVQLIGHLGAKVDLKQLESVKFLGHVSLATN